MKKLLVFVISLLMIVPSAMAALQDTCLLKIDSECYYLYLDENFEIVGPYGSYGGEEFCNNLDNVTFIDSYWHSSESPSEAIECQRDGGVHDTTGDGDPCWTTSKDLLSGVEIPEFSIIAASLALTGAGIGYFKLRRRK